ncbi:hypothetical protein OS493_006354 [Desmophyllum pertusum]|uniref:G-protein coupled receptors family 2 profile 2 domain-containing protein n=1 Tax=Desmophyllum pertusum TaxID=174260 RepID=A0A9X0A5D4_9CNID|nr:hypothetical protein OS493_006354 [Desmophyllum pertusum]
MQNVVISSPSYTYIICGGKGNRRTDLSTLSRNCSPDAAPTSGPQWEDEIRIFVQRFTVASDGSESQKYWRCRKPVNSQTRPLTTNKICHGLDSAYHGYVFWNKCPKNWKERGVRQQCQDEDQNDLLRNLPVFDKDSHVTYRNIFCARCNGAVNTSYWKIKFDCKTWFNVTTLDLRNNLGLLHKMCLVDKKPQDFQLNFLKQCIPRFQDCLKVSQEKNESHCQTECLGYAFPVCSVYNGVRFRNPQCALCNGFKPRVLISDCTTGIDGLLPSLTILFDFSSTSKYSIVVEDKQEGVVKSTEEAWSCSLDQVYDPYAGRCKTIVSSGSHGGHQPSKHNDTHWNPNCTFIAFNKTDYEQLSNGSVYLKLHNKIYSNTTYTIRDSRLLLCMNFTRNMTGTEKERRFRKMKTTPKSLQLLTSIGCIVSMVSLVLLLITYILFAELRNLPGKIIINVAFSLLLYQSVLFSAVKTDDQETCLAVAVLLHYFVLSSFTWMNVMAYDVHRIFTASAVANRRGSYKKRLMKYCLYAWGAPVIVVLVCVIADHVQKGSIGYGLGEEECFISQPRAILYSFVLPVALLMVFNLFAFGHTVIHIVNTRKTTQQVTNQQHRTSVALICVKMASVMGVTWILGIAANVKALSFLWYPYVVFKQSPRSVYFPVVRCQQKGFTIVQK